MGGGNRWWMAMAVGALLAGAGAACGQEPAEADPALRAYLSGNGLLARGVYELAVKEYRDFLRAQPDHAKAATARYGLGVALVRLKKFDEAREALSPLGAEEEFEFRGEAELLLAQCDVAAGRLKEAAERLDRLLTERPDHPVADDAAALLVEAQYVAGEYAAAEEAARAYLARRPGSVQRDRIELLCGMAAMAQGEHARAASLLEGLASRGGVLSEQASLIRAQCLQRAGDLDGAARLFEGLTRNPEGRFAGEAAVGLASVQRQQGRAEDAAGLLDRFLRARPDSPVAGAAMLERARAWFDLGRYDDAKRGFADAGRQTGVARDEVEYWLAKCELRAGDPARAASRLKDAAAKYPESRFAPEMAYDRGIALVRAGRDQDAAPALAEFRNRFPGHPLAADALEAQATVEHRAGRYAESGALCREFVAAYPKHALRPRIDFLAAENLCLEGKNDAAVEAYRAFLGEHSADASASRARLRLGTLLFGQGEYDEAAPLLEDSARRADADPAFRPAVLCLGDLYFQQQAWEKAESLLARYASFGDEAPSADDAVLKCGLALARLGQHDQALRQFDRLLERFPKSGHRVQTIYERACVLLALGRSDEARNAFLRVLKDGGDSPFVPYALTQLGSLALASGDASAAAERFESAAVAATDEATRGEALFQKGQALLAAARYGDAAATFERLLAEFPSHARAAYARAQRAIAASRLSRDAAALQAIEEAEREPSLEPFTRNALAYERAACLTAVGRKQEATEVLRQLADSGDPAVAPYAMLDLAGMEDEAGRLEAAAELLARAQQAAPGGAARELREQATYRLAMCRFKQGQPRESLALLDEYFRTEPKGALVAAATLLAGECRFQLGRAEESARDFRRVVEEFGGDPLAPTALLRLGDALAAAQDWAGSERAFAEYLSRHGDSELWFQGRFGLGWARENQGRHEEAMESYREVVSRHSGPTAARAQFQIGECLFAQKKYEAAARELLKVDILYAYPEWSAAALYEAGRCLESLGQREQAAEQFRLVRDKYPETKWAPLASARLKDAGEPAGR